MAEKRHKRREDAPSVADMTPDERRIHDMEEIVRSMPDNIAAALANARAQPAWCSDVRWRMEMRRRARARNRIWL